MARAVPTAAELLDAVEEMLRREVVPALDGRLAFNARVAAHAVAIVRRELELGPGLSDRHRQRLADLGYGTDVELSQAIRTGIFDERIDEIVATLHASARDQLLVDSPRYISDDDHPADC